MEIKLLHLHPEAMNLYGEYGNLLILQKYLRDEGHSVTLHRATIGDCLNLADYSLIYIGCGTEAASYQVLDALKAEKAAISEYFLNGGLILATGNSFELFGKSINDEKLGAKEGLCLFDFTVSRTHSTRYLSDSIFTFEGDDKPVIGFVNKCSQVSGITSPLFKVKMGLGNEKDSPYEGIISEGFIGTSLIGPLLVRNPHICRYIMDKIYTKAGALRDEKKADMSLQEKAYSTALNELLARCEEK